MSATTLRSGMYEVQPEKSYKDLVTKDPISIKSGRLYDDDEKPDFIYYKDRVTTTPFSSKSMTLYETFAEADTKFRVNESSLKIVFSCFNPCHRTTKIFRLQKPHQ